MSLASFTNLSFGRCIFPKNNTKKYLFNEIGFKWVNNNSFLVRKFSSGNCLIINCSSFTKINYFFNKITFTVESAISPAA
ncbi:hypothetical protein CBP19_02050 [Fischerella thermalis WC1110]|nr:hypothetical protein CBP19_02050 [Fischerella thermalis WC1110]PLZ63714.1 hypothetical protein CBP23_08580 [Fischerella thermalis WC344]